MKRQLLLLGAIIGSVNIINAMNKGLSKNLLKKRPPVPKFNDDNEKPKSMLKNVSLDNPIDSIMSKIIQPIQKLTREEKKDKGPFEGLYSNFVINVERQQEEQSKIFSQNLQQPQIQKQSESLLKKRKPNPYADDIDLTSIHVLNKDGKTIKIRHFIIKRQGGRRVIGEVHKVGDY